VSKLYIRFWRNLKPTLNFVETYQLHIPAAFTSVETRPPCWTHSIRSWKCSSSVTSTVSNELGY
jgi:hypothetical protein